MTDYNMDNWTTIGERIVDAIKESPNKLTWLSLNQAMLARLANESPGIIQYAMLGLDHSHRMYAFGLKVLVDNDIPWDQFKLV